MPTIKDVAKLARTSTATVSYVFNGKRKVSTATEARVREAAVTLGYMPNQAARTLATKSSRTIAAVLSDIANPFFAPMLRGVEEVARRRGYLLLVGDSNESVEREEEYLASLTDRYIDGILLSPASDQHRPPRGIEAWAGHLVLVNRRLEGVNSDLVTTDNRLGAMSAARHLLEQGHTRIAIIVGPQDVSTHAERLAGFSQALRDAGVPPPKSMIRTVGLDSGSSYAATKDVFASRKSSPTALFCSSGIHALGAWQALLEMGLSVPGDVSFITFDRPSWTQLVQPPITTIEQPSYEMGRKAAALLLDDIDRRQGTQGAQSPRKPRHVRLPPQLHIAGSVAILRPQTDGGR